MSKAARSTYYEGLPERARSLKPTLLPPGRRRGESSGSYSSIHWPMRFRGRFLGRGPAWPPVDVPRRACADILTTRRCPTTRLILVPTHQVVGAGRLINGIHTLADHIPVVTPSTPRRRQSTPRHDQQGS